MLSASSASQHQAAAARRRNAFSLDFDEEGVEAEEAMDGAGGRCAPIPPPGLRSVRPIRCFVQSVSIMVLCPLSSGLYSSVLCPGCPGFSQRQAAAARRRNAPLLDFVEEEGGEADEAVDGAGGRCPWNNSSS